MIHVIPLASARAGFQVQPSAPFPATWPPALDATAPRQYVGNAIGTCSLMLGVLPIGSAGPLFNQVPDAAQAGRLSHD